MDTWRVITSITRRAPGFETVTHRVSLTVRPGDLPKQVAYSWLDDNGYDRSQFDSFKLFDR